MKKCLFIDRDGTIIAEPPVDFQIDSLEKLEFLPKVFRGLSLLKRYTNFEWAMVTNQDGLGTASFPEDTFWPAHNKMLRALENEGITFDEFFIDRSFEAEQAPTRKPRTGMLTKYFTGEYDMANSFVIGDRLTDVVLAKNLGAKAIWIAEPARADELELDNLQEYVALISTDWDEISAFVLSADRTHTVVRKTAETDITVSIRADGQGVGRMSTGLGFFDHMLDQLARHSGISITITAKGDLHIDEHHTIEDTAITLGEALRKALGNKLGINRYGFYLPMDEADAQVGIDFGGRPCLEWHVPFTRERIGDVPTEMFKHFFWSLTNAALCNLNVRASGENDHHKAEAVFKAVARAIRMAIKQDPDAMLLPSTKEML